MKVKNLKRLVQNLLHTTSESKFTIEELQDFFPEFIEISRVNNPNNQHLLRVMQLVTETKPKPFKLECTTRSFVSCFSIADEMPRVVWGKDKMIDLNTWIYSFKVPTERIYIDFDAIMPIIKERLAKVMNHKVYDKSDRPISLSKAIELYEEASEKELIVDLSGLEYASVMLPSYMRAFAALIIFKGYEENKDGCMYLDDASEYIAKFQHVMDVGVKEKMNNWVRKVKWGDQYA
jgi:hypothetical protein